MQFRQDNTETKSGMKLNFLPQRDSPKINNKIKCTGWLLKQGGYWKTWRKRYFKLRKNGFLEYYYYAEDEQPRGKIDLTTCSSKPKEIPQQEGWATYGFTVKDFLFEILTPNRIYILCADSADKRSLWVKYVIETIEATSPTYKSQSYITSESESERISKYQNNNQNQNSEEQEREEKIPFISQKTESEQNTSVNDSMFNLEKYPNEFFFSAEEHLEENEKKYFQSKKYDVNFHRKWGHMSQMLMQNRGYVVWINHIIERILRNDVGYSHEKRMPTNELLRNSNEKQQFLRNSNEKQQILRNSNETQSLLKERRNSTNNNSEKLIILSNSIEKVSASNNIEKRNSSNSIERRTNNGLMNSTDSNSKRNLNLKKIKDLAELRNGVVLIEIVQFLSRKKIKYHENPTQVVESLQNINILISFLLKENPDFPFTISADAIATQNQNIKHTLDLIWAIMFIYEIRPTRYIFYTGPDALFYWVNKLLEEPPFIEDFSTSFEKNNIISRLINACFERKHGKNNENFKKLDNLQSKLDYCTKHWHCPNIFNFEDFEYFEYSIDESCLLVWLRYLFKVIEND